MTTFFIGNYYELTAGVATKYYYAGSQRVAMRKNGTLHYMFSDHLGSTSITTDSAGNVVSELRYKPWGEVRYAGGNTPTQYTFTGQRDYTSDFGLMYFNARWVDPSTGRFAQADTVIPQGQGVQAWDRYAFVNNNPVRYIDPSGHMADDGDDGGCVSDLDCAIPPVNPPNGGNGESNSGDGGHPLLSPNQNTDYYQSINLWPDYYIGSLFVPIGNPFFGVNVSGIIDAYGNFYFDVGVGVSLGPSLNGGGGWLSGPDNDREYIVEDFLQGHSVNISAGSVLGIGVNNVNPSYMQSGNEGSGIENISVEAIGTSLGATLVFGWGWLIYDKGDDTPWIWQGD